MPSAYSVWMNKCKDMPSAYSVWMNTKRQLLLAQLQNRSELEHLVEHLYMPCKMGLPDKIEENKPVSLKNKTNAKMLWLKKLEDDRE